MRPAADPERAGATPFLAELDRAFARLHSRSIKVVGSIPEQALYRQGCKREGEGDFPISSCGEQILRSAGSVEQTFGGITANLWDDPFEWTLPEALSTRASVIEYLHEVEATRRRGFAFLSSDADLQREVSIPAGTTRTLFALFVETLVRAADHQGRAVATAELFSDQRIPLR